MKKIWFQDPMNKKKSLALLLESGDAFAQAVPDEISDVHVGNEITSFVVFNWVHLMGGLKGDIGDLPVKNILLDGATTLVEMGRT